MGRKNRNLSIRHQSLGRQVRNPDDQFPLFEFRMESFSTTLEAKIKENPHWGEIILDKDLCACSSVLAIIQQEARESYNQCSQRSQDSIAQHKRSFDNCFTRVNTVGENIPSNQAQASPDLTTSVMQSSSRNSVILSI